MIMFLHNIAYNAKELQHEILVFFEVDSQLTTNKHEFQRIICNGGTVDVSCHTYLSIGIEYFIDAAVFVKSPRSILGDPDATSQFLAQSR